MPELPDVQVFRQTAKKALGQRIKSVSIRPEGMRSDTSSGTLRKALRGHQLTATRRHGKQLFIRSDEARGRWLRLHFGMTGSLQWSEDDEDEPSHTRLRLDMADGHSLAFRCRRKLGQIGLVDDPDDFIANRELGPDPLDSDFDLRAFRQVLDGRKGTIKGTLMNQKVLAGLGNIYTDEALFQAGIHPETPTQELGGTQLQKLWHAVDKVLNKAIDYRVDADRMPRTWLLPNRGDGESCPRCPGTIRKTTVSGRSTYACDRHQRQPT